APACRSGAAAAARALRPPADLGSALPPAVAPEQAGTCPPAEKEAAGGNCTEECQSDAGCEKGQKCCRTGCGTSCRIPDDKPGSCPGDTNGISGLGFCRADCTRDSDCAADKKCCLNGCGKMACATPVP
uniref:WAP four-disulfide core domain 2 n=1 Tax=Varanus komodoensis TaxID=61221 RepID=A0A8D2KZ74_VARKO